MLIDIHVHTCRPRHPKLTRPNGSRYPTPEELIAMMDEAGIDVGVMMCTPSPECRYSQVLPEELLDIHAQYPDRVVPFCNMDPRFVANSPEANFLPLLEAYAELGCKGVGEFIPNLPFDDPLILNFFKQVEEMGLPLTFHLAHRIGGLYGCYDDPGLPRLERVLKECPKLVLLSHSQVFWAEIGQLADPEERGGYPKGTVVEGRVVQLMREYPNLCGDLSAGSGYNAISRDPEFGYRFMEEFQDRLFFGTDIANIPQDLPIVGYFAKLRDEGLVPAEVLDKIAWRNAATLLDLDVEGP